MIIAIYHINTDFRVEDEIEIVNILLCPPPPPSPNRALLETYRDLLRQVREFLKTRYRYSGNLET